MDQNKSLQKIDPEKSLKKLSEDSSLAKRGLRDIGIWPKIEELFEKLKSQYEAKKYQDCIIAAEEILKTDSNHFFTLCYYGRSLFHLERYEEALKIFDRCLEEENEYYFIWSFRGDVNYKLNDYINAVSDFDKSLRFELIEFWYKATGGAREDKHPELPQSADALDNHMYYFNDDNKGLDEICFFRKALFYLSTNFETYQKDDVGIKRAIEALKEVIKLNHDNWFAKNKLVETLQLLAEKQIGSDNTKALANIDEALNISPSDTNLITIKAILLHALGDKESAAEWIEKAKMIRLDDDGIESIYKKIHNLE